MSTADSLDYRAYTLAAQAEVLTIIDEVVEELLEPMMNQALAMQWTVLPDEIKQKIKEELPETYQAILEIVGNNV